MRAVFHVHKMRGGAQSHLMCCEDRGYYVVKFLNNPQDLRVLANEMLANGLADLVGLPVPKCAPVDVSEKLLDDTPELCLEGVGGRIRCAAGRHFGSRLPVDPSREPLFDFVPDQTLELLVNVQAFAGMLMFDQWTCNTDSRQAVYHRDAGDRSRYRALMIDQGFCFNDGEWNFPDSPLRGLYARPVVYQGVTGWESFEPWLTVLREMEWSNAAAVAGRVPLEWYAFQDDALERLLDTLDRRRKGITELLDAVRRTTRNPFPNWGKS